MSILVSIYREWKRNFWCFSLFFLIKCRRFITFKIKFNQIRRTNRMLQRGQRPFGPKRSLVCAGLPSFCIFFLLNCWHGPRPPHKLGADIHSLNVFWEMILGWGVWISFSQEFDRVNQHIVQIVFSEKSSSRQRSQGSRCEEEEDMLLEESRGYVFIYLFIFISSD